MSGRQRDLFLSWHRPHRRHHHHQHIQICQDAYVLLSVGVLRHEVQQALLGHVEGPAHVDRLEGAAQLFFSGGVVVDG